MMNTYQIDLRVIRQTMLALSMVVLLLVASGCTRTKYGSSGRTVPVTLQSVPPGADIYLVPLTEWHGQGGKAMLDDVAKLEPYLVPGNETTPATMDLPLKKMAFVAVAPGSPPSYTLITPREGATYTVKLRSRR